MVLQAEGVIRLLTNCCDFGTTIHNTGEHDCHSLDYAPFYVLHAIVSQVGLFAGAIYEKTSDPPTARLILRPFALTDASRTCSAWPGTEGGLTTLNIPHPYTDGMAEQMDCHASRILRPRRIRHFCHSPAYQPVRLSGRRVYICAAARAQAELGYWIGSTTYWNHGYWSKPRRQCSDMGLTSLDQHRIHASYMTRNPASRDVMQKIGMTYEGCLRQHVQKWGIFGVILPYTAYCGVKRWRKPAGL